MAEILILNFIKFAVAILRLLPNSVREWILSNILRFGTVFIPSYRRVSEINLRIAYPESTAEWRRYIIKENFKSLAKAISDFVRMPSLSKAWVEANIDIPYWPRYMELKGRVDAPGIIVATGHIGSFELQGYALSLLGYPLSFVVRNFKKPLIDKWWNGIRGKLGNKVLNRQGAYRQVVKELKAGRDVAILFDQNVKRNQAVFVPWFGHLAATTKSIGLAAIETEAIVLVVAMISLKSGKYRIEVTECNFEHIYKDDSLDRAEKVKIITDEVSNHYQALIKKFPEGWFWMHRRWKTTPTEAEESIYSLAKQGSIDSVGLAK
jgi:KDO2-lipid IV(A) lauroyltransferase